VVTTWQAGPPAKPIVVAAGHRGLLLAGLAVAGSSLSKNTPKGQMMESDMERRVELVNEVAGLKREVESIHRENQIRHENHLREKTAQDKVIEDLAKDVKELLALANQGRGGLWAGMAIAGSVGAAISWVASHLLFIPKG
jgi:hypothetical protein